MKWTKWTVESIKEIAKTCPNVRHFHHYYRGAEKAAKRLGILETLFPDKQEHSNAYTIEQITLEAEKYTKRSHFQFNNPSMYNAAKKLNLLNTLLPVQLNKKYTDVELVNTAKSFKTIADWESKSNGSYQVACRRGLVAQYGPKRTQGVSRAELEILSFLQSLSTDFKTKRFGNDYELDCYSESLKLGVEYNGLYWHSDTNKPRDYHIKKTKHFESLGIRIIHIWEHEWRDRCPQVKNYLMSACKANTFKIGARKCEFKTISPSIARQFMKDNHIQGSPITVRLALGCFFNGTLLSVSTFGDHHRKSDHSKKVLNRFACLPGHTVSGCLAKMTAMAFKALGPLLSWADYSKSQATGYVAAGWVVQSTSPIDYFYSDSQAKYIGKQSRRKGTVGTPEGMTEAEHSRADGLYRIWDCGKILLFYG